MNKYRFLEQEHLHQLNVNGEWKNLSGTSSIVGVLQKNLVWWSAELAAVECLEAGLKIPTIRDEYLEAVASKDKKKAIDALQKKYPIFKKARFAHFNEKKKKAEKGVDLHAELERFIKDWIATNHFLYTKSYPAQIMPFIEWSEKNVKKFLWSEAHCYSQELWTGGIADFGCELNNGTLVLGDFKSSKSDYLSHHIQGAGYAIEIEENGLLDKDGNLLMKLDRPIEKILIVPFGADVVEPKESNIGIGDLKKGFKACVELYRILGQEKQND